MLFVVVRRSMQRCYHGRVVKVLSQVWTSLQLQNHATVVEIRGFESLQQQVSRSLQKIFHYLTLLCCRCLKLMYTKYFVSRLIFCGVLLTLIINNDKKVETHSFSHSTNSFLVCPPE